MKKQRRLVYADEVEDLINGLDSLPLEEDVQMLVNSLSTVDAVEVVRCKDCKYGKFWCNLVNKSAYICRNVNVGFFEWGMAEDDFCSYGERKDND